MNPFVKLAASALLLIAIISGVFFTGYRYGTNKQKVIVQEKIIQAGERHAEIEKRQSKVRANRGNIDIIAILHKGEF